MKQRLWNRNFTIITLGTAVSAIGGVALNIALSLVVFDQTGSSLSTALFLVLSNLPALLVPLLLAPAMDHLPRKPFIYSMDFLTAALYLTFGVYLSVSDFNYGAYVALGVAGGFIGSVYSIAYGALYPDLVPVQCLEKAYSVSAVIYPIATVVMSPVAAVIYQSIGIRWLFFGEGALTLIAAIAECFIRIEEKHAEKGFRVDLSRFAADWREGLDYLRREKGIRSLYTYMAVTNATGGANSMMVMAWFQSSPLVTTTMYSLLISAETLGRVLGGVVHYFTNIPDKRKERMIEFVYYTYELCDGVLLFLPWGLMLAAKFLCGFLGINSATLRSTAVQRNLPTNIRARVNSLLNVVVTLGMILVQLFAGALGEWLPYRAVTVLMVVCAMVTCLLTVTRNRREIGRLYTQPRIAASTTEAPAP